MMTFGLGSYKVLTSVLGMFEITGSQPDEGMRYPLCYMGLEFRRDI